MPFEAHITYVAAERGSVGEREQGMGREEEGGKQSNSTDHDLYLLYRTGKGTAKSKFENGVQYVINQNFVFVYTPLQ